jgi:tetratricopeptide (TPR) repeat protein
MRAHAVLVLMLAAALGAGCQRTPAPAPPAAVDVGVRAAEALAAGRYQEAFDLYRQAVAASPESVPLRYGLGVAASYLARVDDAARDFEWVVARAAPDSLEARGARDWLVAAGRWRPVAAAGPSSARPSEPSAGQGTVRGTVLGPEGRPLARQQLFLIGLDGTPTQEQRYRLRTDENGRFSFAGVAPGAYKLTDRIAAAPQWRLRIELGPSQNLQIDLGAANATAVRDDFKS